MRALREIREHAARENRSAHPEYAAGGQAASLIYPDLHSAELHPADYKLEQKPRPTQPMQPMPLQSNNAPPPLLDSRRRLLTPHAREASAAAAERRSQNNMGLGLGAPPLEEPMPERRPAHPEYDPARSEAAALLYPERPSISRPATQSQPPSAANSSVHHHHPPLQQHDHWTMAGVPATDAVAPRERKVAGRPRAKGTALPAAPAPAAAPHAPVESVSGRDRQQEDVVAGLRTQVAALQALLEHGVTVQLPRDTPTAVHVWFGPPASSSTAAPAWQWRAVPDTQAQSCSCSRHVGDEASVERRCGY